LVLDEPTNDLDLESLELLEAALQDYAGTLLLVSHDRAFLDNVVTQTLAAEGGGAWREYVGGYSDWLRQRGEPEEKVSNEKRQSPAIRERPRAKLSYKESRELEQLPVRLEALEAEQHALAAKLGAPEYYRQAPEVMRADQRRAEELEALIHAGLERWEALEARAKQAGS
ncbi:MAG: ABC transporter ATP-binding protein, partial [Burkholderiales bacterium]